MAEPAPRVGLGFDAHRWADGRELWLGGVRFDGDRGLAGHSDGDVVCHALADAVLGAVALGDIGEHFSDDDPSMAGIAGATLLKEALRLARGAGPELRSCDVTVICERPAVAPRRDEMRDRLADVLGIERSTVSVKATRPEGLGLTGDGVGCLAIVVMG